MKETSEINIITEKLVSYFKNKGNVKNIIVFGSFADGTNTRHSDLDVIVIKKTGKRFLDRYKEYPDLDDRMGIPVELFIYTPEEWNAVKKRKFFENTPMMRVKV